MSKNKNYDKALYRYADILSRIALDERPTNRFLMQEYNVTERTIQRDMKKLGENFPLKKDANGGWLFDYDFALKGSTYSIDEAITLTNALKQVQKAGNEFEKTIKLLFKKFIFPVYKNPYYIKPPLYEYIDMDSPLIDSLEEAIINNNICEIALNEHFIRVCPYKIINHDGIWYLFCENSTTDKLEHFVIAKIDNVKVYTDKFVPRKDIEDILSYIQSPYYTEHIKYEVVIEVSKNISEYFLVKQQLPSQKIVEKKDDGSLVLSYFVSHEEEIDNLIKSWLPDIRVIKPKQTKERIYKELQNYLKRNEPVGEKE